MAMMPPPDNKTRCPFPPPQPAPRGSAKGRQSTVRLAGQWIAYLWHSLWGRVGVGETDSEFYYQGVASSPCPLERRGLYHLGTIGLFMNLLPNQDWSFV